jgi:hypothetical protein
MISRIGRCYKGLYPGGAIDSDIRARNRYSEYKYSGYRFLAPFRAWDVRGEIDFNTFSYGLLTRGLKSDRVRPAIGCLLATARQA